MNSEFKFYLVLLIRRLPAMLAMVVVATGVGLSMALTLPPTYRAEARLLVENSQISNQMVVSTVQTNAEKQLQIIEQRLMTRANMLAVSNKFGVFENAERLQPDDVFRMMAQNTGIALRPGDSQRATLMIVSFASEDPQIASDVVNEFVTIIESESAQISKSEATETAEFFEAEVNRLSEELGRKSAEIVTFKEANKDALPDDQDYRLIRQSQLQDRLNLAIRDRGTQLEQRNRLEALGAPNANQPVTLTPEQQQLANLQSQLRTALSVYSDSHPRVRTLRAEIAQIEAAISPAGEPPRNTDPMRAMLDIQMSDIDARIKFLDSDIASMRTEIDRLQDAIERTPEVSIRLGSLTRDYQNIQNQYNSAVSSLATAKVGESVELQGRGERVSVIERAVPPNRPSGPNRKLIAGGGFLAGGAFATLFFVLTELLNRSIRRPVDLMRGLGVQPLATIPFLERETAVRRRHRVWSLVMLVVIIGVPLALWATHTFYLPLDIMVERFLDSLRG